MRRIVIREANWRDQTFGLNYIVPVKLDWPELQLSEGQVVTNACAKAAGIEEPFPDQSYVEVEVERVRLPEMTPSPDRQILRRDAINALMADRSFADKYLYDSYFHGVVEAVLDVACDAAHYELPEQKKRWREWRDRNRAR